MKYLEFSISASKKKYQDVIDDTEGYGGRLRIYLFHPFLKQSRIYTS
jgi:hypothetical protein